MLWNLWEESIQLSSDRQPVASNSIHDDNGNELDLAAADMQRMDMGTVNSFPNFYAAWDPDGRFHSILPSLALITSYFVDIDFQVILRHIPHYCLIGS